MIDWYQGIEEVIKSYLIVERSLGFSGGNVNSG
jgi:hypothetical protein